MRLFLLAAGIIPILFFSCATIEKQESGVDSDLIEGNVVENQQSASHSLESDLQSSEKSTQKVFEAPAVDMKIPPAENSDISGGKRQQTEESRLVKEDRARAPLASWARAATCEPAFSSVVAALILHGFKLGAWAR